MFCTLVALALFVMVSTGLIIFQAEYCFRVKYRPYSRTESLESAISSGMYTYLPQLVGPFQVFVITIVFLGGTWLLNRTPMEDIPLGGWLFFVFVWYLPLLIWTFRHYEKKYLS